MRRINFCANQADITVNAFLGTLYMTRVKAASIHLLICCVIALALWCLMRLVWYPSVYFQALGGAGLVLLLVGVDVVIGPLLTLVIYKQGKKNLRFDLAVIALLQISALVYGSYVVYAARPVYLVFSVDRFEIVTASDIDATELEKARDPTLRTLPITGPRIIAATLPTDPKERQAILFSSLENGADVSHLPRFYVPFSDQQADAAKRATSFESLGSRKQLLLDLIKMEGVEESSMQHLAYLPVRGKRENATAIIDKRDGNLVRLVALDPWS